MRHCNTHDVWFEDGKFFSSRYGMVIPLDHIRMLYTPSEVVQIRQRRERVFETSELRTPAPIVPAPELSEVRT